MKKTCIIVIAVLFFILALGLTLYPVISSIVNAKYASEIHTAYEEVIRKTDDAALTAARAEADAYNEAITPGAMDVHAYSREAIAAASENYDNLLNLRGDGIMGYVSVPKLNLELPILHGTNADALERGVGHLLGSSLPVGGSGTHTILTGHSGMATQKMFTDLINLTAGDVFYLEVLGDKLAYQVDEIHTVLPYDTSLLGIIPGMDCCTLVTCTPYGVNTHRLLVRGTRIPYEQAQEEERVIAIEEVPASEWSTEYIRGILIGLFIVLVIVVVILFYTANHRRGRYEAS